ncbi:hypothetical protein Naga_102398g1 [Nannochloropsis gaditana]|uniref:Uncharacterized protein n=1 Tax=Nannochloropsis gaditana TaxID=72520 RepID=W7TKZ5_9STRA|nr:hypothetical protein Naga_102398g1 [Nannochloropsis gaditana]
MSLFGRRGAGLGASLEGGREKEGREGGREGGKEGGRRLEEQAGLATSNSSSSLHAKRPRNASSFRAVSRNASSPRAVTSANAVTSSGVRRAEALEGQKLQ